MKFSKKQATAKFGLGQVDNPTPASYERFVKIFVGVSGLILAWMPTNNLVPSDLQDVVTPICNLLNSILIFLLPFIGVKIPTPTVPTKDVNVIETK